MRVLKLLVGVLMGAPLVIFAQSKNNSKDPNLERGSHPPHETEASVKGYGLGEGSKFHKDTGAGMSPEHSVPPDKSSSEWRISRPDRSPVKTSSEAPAPVLAPKPKPAPEPSTDNVPLRSRKGEF
jgi:hypothetical protein